MDKAKEIFEKLDKEELQKALESDHEFYLDEFVYDATDSYKYADSDGNAEDLTDAFVEHMKDDCNCLESDTVDYIINTAKEFGVGFSAELVKEIANMLGYDSISEYICDKGWSKKTEKKLDKAQSDLEEYLRDQTEQQKEKEDMFYRSRTW